MVAGFTFLLSKLAAVVSWFSELFVNIFKAVWDVLTDAVCWVLEKFLDIAVSALQGIDVSGINTAVNSYGSIPAGVLQVMACIGVGQALGIIATAIGIRFILQLIPFVRLGS